MQLSHKVRSLSAPSSPHAHGEREGETEGRLSRAILCSTMMWLTFVFQKKGTNGGAKGKYQAGKATTRVKRMKHD